MKRKVRLTEAQLMRIIEQSTKQILRENSFKDRMQGAISGYKLGKNAIDNEHSAYTDAQMKNAKFDNIKRTLDPAYKNVMKILNTNDIDKIHDYAMKIKLSLKYVLGNDDETNN